MKASTDILIIGGGVIGLTTAWYLAREGARVKVIDRGEAGRQSSWAGAGILPPSDPDQARTPFERLRALSHRLFAELSQMLLEQTGLDNGYVQCGGIELPDPANPDAPLPTEEWHGEGTPFRLLDRLELVDFYPEIAESITQGVWLPELAQVRNPWHIRALVAGCAYLGVELCPNWPVRKLNTAKDRVLSVEGESGCLSAEQFLFATGAWTEELLAKTGWSPGIVPVRGQMILYQTGKAGVRPVLLQGKRYLVARTDGHLLVGSTEELVGFDPATTEEGVKGLQLFAGSILPPLTGLPLAKSWAGLRPGSPDGVPYLGTLPGWANLHVSAGHFRAGIQLSTGSGQLMARYLLGKPELLSLADFRPDRVSGSSSIPVCPRGL